MQIACTRLERALLAAALSFVVGTLRFPCCSERPYQCCAFACGHQHLQFESPNNCTQWLKALPSHRLLPNLTILGIHIRHRCGRKICFPGQKSQIIARQPVVDETRHQTAPKLSRCLLEGKKPASAALDWPAQKMKRLSSEYPCWATLFVAINGFQSLHVEKCSW